MTREQAERIIEQLADSAGYTEDDVYLYEGYSGRGMFGDKTFAVVGPPDCDRYSVELKKMRRDQLGKSDNVWY